MSKKFCSGSEYTGAIILNKMNGRGVYKYPDGTEYHGEFKDGQFHGDGMILTPEKFHLHGRFVNGRCDDYELKSFEDGLKYKETDWTYCSASDRRYYAEIKNGLCPVGDSYETKEKPSRKIPNGCYDTEEGIFNPENCGVFKADDISVCLRNLSKHEQHWAIKNCRNTEINFGFVENIVEENLETMKEVNYAIENNCKCLVCFCRK